VNLRNDNANLQAGYAFGTQRSLVRIQSSRSRLEADLRANESRRRYTKSLLSVGFTNKLCYSVLAKTEGRMVLITSTKERIASLAAVRPRRLDVL
jgi:hypothetical protein